MTYEPDVWITFSSSGGIVLMSSLTNSSVHTLFQVNQICSQRLSWLKSFTFTILQLFIILDQTSSTGMTSPKYLAKQEKSFFLYCLCKLHNCFTMKNWKSSFKIIEINLTSHKYIALLLLPIMNKYNWLWLIFIAQR